ncbi:MAG: hypothetical protein ABFD77_05380 [Thermotogota bacterium]
MARRSCVVLPRAALLGLLVLLSCLLFGCRSSKGPAEYIFSLAEVSSVEVRRVEEYPTRLSAVVKGVLRDTCTRIDSVRQDPVSGNKLVLTVTTERPVVQVCAQAVVPFEITAPLLLEGLPPGEYSITANSVSTTFKWHGSTAIPQ